MSQEKCPNCKQWIKDEQKRIKEVPVKEIASPCKISNKKYKNVPIFVRAYENTQRIHKGFKVNTGELFYYIYVLANFGEVLAFSKEDNSFVDWQECIDWKKVIDRNIVKKAEAIFKVLKWDLGLIDTSGQITFMF